MHCGVTITFPEEADKKTADMVYFNGVQRLSDSCAIKDI